MTTENVCVSRIKIFFFLLIHKLNRGLRGHMEKTEMEWEEPEAPWEEDSYEETAGKILSSWFECNLVDIILDFVAGGIVSWKNTESFIVATRHELGEAVLPLAGLEEGSFSRFRGARLGDDLKTVIVCTRTGGDPKGQANSNRQEAKDTIDALRALPQYLHDADEDYDHTFCYFKFQTEPSSSPVWHEWARQVAPILGVSLHVSPARRLRQCLALVPTWNYESWVGQEAALQEPEEIEYYVSESENMEDE
jgi:hypothetical protein